MDHDGKSKISVLILAMLLLTVISGTVLLAACDGISAQDTINENQNMNPNDDAAGFEGNSTEDNGNIEGNVFVTFESESDFPGQYKELFSNYIAGLFTEAYSPYYQVKGFEFSNVEHVLTDTGIEVTFFLKMIDQNYYKDPDTVEYIKEAKESGSKHYQQLYDEYNQPKESNFDLKFTAEIDNGEIDIDSVQIFTNASPKGVEYVPIRKGFFPGA